MRTIKGFCPMGCGETLFAAADGYITCSRLGCPRPDAASEILADFETEHIVELGKRAFTMRHPLRERLGDALMRCQLHSDVAAMSAAPAPPGRYRLTEHSNSSLIWDRLPDDKGVPQ